MLNVPVPDFLHTFVTVVECGSFTRAAKRVHRTQSAVSMQMRRLEEDVGRRLFERSGKVIRLTADGEVFLDHARRILRTYHEAMMAFRGKPLEGEITLGMPDDYAKGFLPPILARFVRTYPTIRVHIVCDLSRRLNSMLADGSVDVALVTEGEGTGGGIVVHRERLVWATSAQHHAHEDDPVPLAVFHSGDVFRRSAIEQLEEHGRRARVVVTSPSIAGIDAAVEAGIAVACICRTNMRAGLRILSPQEGFPNLPDLRILLQRAGDEPNEIADQLVIHIVDTFRNLRAAEA